MAVRKARKIEAQVVEAIRRLQAVQGSTPREIGNYIAQEYNIPGPEIRRHVQLALKRGVTYGILQRVKGGYYTYNHCCGKEICANSGDANVDIRCKRRRRRKGKRRSRRGRSSCRRRRRSRCRSRRRRKSRRRKSCRSRRRRRTQCPKEIDGDESIVLSKQSESDTAIGKGRASSNHSTISGNSEEEQK